MTFLDYLSVGLLWLYDAIQLLPDFLLKWLAGIMPFKADTYAPRGLFIPRPTLPPEVSSPDDPRKGWGGLSNGILILRSYVKITGLVIYVETRPPNASWNHETFAIVPDNHDYMNFYNDQVNPGSTSSAIPMPADKMVMECEGVVGSALPVAGQSVEVTGAFGIQMAWGYIEIHTCYSWRVIG